MNYYEPNSASYQDFAIDRSQFMRRVYGHVAGAVLLFIAIESLLLSSPALKVAALQVGGRFMWLVVLLAFMGVSWIATQMAHGVSRSTQYLGLGLYTTAEAFIFLPLLARLEVFDPSGNILLKAVLITLGLFIGLSGIALTTKANFTGWGRFVKIGMGVALGIIVTSCIFGFSLGILFISCMIILMAACILWETQTIAQNYPVDSYVGASVALFASLATLLWYVIRLVAAFSDDY